MNAEDIARFAAGETSQRPPAPQTGDTAESDAIRKDTTYSSGSETETEQKQDQDGLPDTVDDDIDPADDRVVPGTGGPDDVGDVDVDPGDIDLTGHGGDRPHTQ